ncbi:MAG: monovalent cation/H+ antiporter subunit A [Nitrospira sp.]|nr:MAG: monovalent cation/H+ antiporter subunit A [Nitrospira sp.]
MQIWGDLPLLILLLVTALGAVIVRDLIGAVLILGSYSFFLALCWAWMGSPDVAFTEAVVGSGMSTVLFLFALFQTVPQEDPSSHRDTPWFVALGLGVLGLLLLYGAIDLPRFGDIAAPANAYLSPTYIQQSLEQMNTPNIVTAILMDYRSLDTLIETAVVFTAGVACALLLRRHDS